MSSPRCPECEEEMEEVVGFSDYFWCRECHLTKKLEKNTKIKDPQKSSEKLKV